MLVSRFLVLSTFLVPVLLAHLPGALGWATSSAFSVALPAASAALDASTAPAAPRALFALAASAAASTWPALVTLLPVLYVAGATPFLIAFDVRHRRLPNVIVLPGLVVVALAAAAAALWAGVDPGGTALVAGVTLLVFATFRVAGALASGDVKLAVLLAAALAPLAGAGLALYVLAGSTAALTAGLLSVLALARLRRRRCRRRRRRRCAVGVAVADVTAADVTAAGMQVAGGAAAGMQAAGGAAAGKQAAGGSAGPLSRGRHTRRTADIPLGPCLLLGFWVAVTAAIVRPAA